MANLLYADDLVLCSELDLLKVMVEHFVEVCRREDLKFNADKSKVMVLGEEEGLKREIRVDRAQIEQV